MEREYLEMFEFFEHLFFFLIEVCKSYRWLLRDCCTFDFKKLLTTFLLLAFQIALQFPYRFWDSKVQGADFFGHVPPSASKRGLFAVFYDMDPQVKSLVECGVNPLITV